MHDGPLPGGPQALETRRPGPIEPPNAGYIGVQGYMGGVEGYPRISKNILGYKDFEILNPKAERWLLLALLLFLLFCVTGLNVLLSYVRDSGLALECSSCPLRWGRRLRCA